MLCCAQGSSGNIDSLPVIVIVISFVLVFLVPGIIIVVILDSQRRRFTALRALDGEMCTAENPGSMKFVAAALAAAVIIHDVDVHWSVLASVTNTIGCRL